MKKITPKEIQQYVEKNFTYYKKIEILKSYSKLYIIKLEQDFLVTKAKIVHSFFGYSSKSEFNNLKSDNLWPEPTLNLVINYGYNHMLKYSTKTHTIENPNIKIESGALLMEEESFKDRRFKFKYRTEGSECRDIMELFQVRKISDLTGLEVIALLDKHRPNERIEGICPIDTSETKFWIYRKHNMQLGCV